MSLSDEHGKDDGSQIPGDKTMHELNVEEKELPCMPSRAGVIRSVMKFDGKVTILLSK